MFCLSLFCKNSKDTTFLKLRHFVTKNISGVVPYGIRPTFQDSFSQPYDLLPFFWNLIHKLFHPFLTGGVAFVPYETMQIIMHF